MEISHIVRPVRWSRSWARAFSLTVDFCRDHPRWDLRRVAMSSWDPLATGAIYCLRIVDPVVTFDEAPRICEEYVDRNPQQGVKLGVTSI